MEGLVFFLKVVGVVGRGVRGVIVGIGLYCFWNVFVVKEGSVSFYFVRGRVGFSGI